MNDSPKVEVPSDRRSFIRRIMKWGAVGGVAAMVLTRLRGHTADTADTVNMLLPGQVTEVKATDVYDSYYYEGTGTYRAHSPVLEAYNTSPSGIVAAMYGHTDSPQGRSVWGYASATSGPTMGVLGYIESATGVAVNGFVGASGATATGIGVMGTSYAPRGMGVRGYGSNNGAIGVKGDGWAGAIPIVAQGAAGQTANLQEWQDSSGSVLAGVNASGSLGVWNSNPRFNVHVIGTTDPASVTVDGIGIVGPNFQFRRARGTAASPSAVQQNDGILFLVGKGYGSTGFSAGGRANLSMFAAENWTDTAQGTYMTFKTTQIGTTTQTEKMRITDTGNILPPSDNVGNIGTASNRWALVRAKTITPGDLVFENGYRLTEDKKSGLLLVNQKGRTIAKFDEEGNLHIKGKVLEDL